MSDSLLPRALPPGPLLSIINRARVILLNNRLKQFELSAGQYPVFMCLLRHPGITQETMARYFHLIKAQSPGLLKMEDAGYISRNVDPANRRAFAFHLQQRDQGLHQRFWLLTRSGNRLSAMTCQKKKKYRCWPCSNILQNPAFRPSGD